MDASKLTEEERAEWWLFLKASPIGVDPNIIDPKVLDQLPENIKAKLADTKTSALIYLLGNENGLNEDQISDIARTVREIALGNLNPAELTSSLKNKLGTTDVIAQKIASKLTSEIIAPNYFQISQLYKRKHDTVATPKQPAPPRAPLTGRPLESLTPKQSGIPGTPSQKVSSMNDWAGEIETKEEETLVVANKPSKNVVDLRKTAEPLPNKLPPAPPVIGSRE
jgi:hypothetical protein